LNEPRFAIEFRRVGCTVRQGTSFVRRKSNRLGGSGHQRRARSSATPIRP